MSRNRDNNLLNEEYNKKIALHNEAGMGDMIPSAAEVADMMIEAWPWLVGLGGAALASALEKVKAELAKKNNTSAQPDGSQKPYPGTPAPDYTNIQKTPSFQRNQPPPPPNS